MTSHAPAPHGARRWLFATTAVFLSLISALAIAEVAARAYGHRPRLPAARPEPGFHVPDPVLGWKPVPGHYRLGPYSPGGVPADVTIRSDGSRESGGGAAAGRPQVVLVGCSFTMGWAVSDDETWGWRLQELRPDLEVVNRGVGGYGTLQALMLLEDLLGRQGQRPARVLYGFIDHGLRNVAAPLWLWSLSFNERTVETPYALLTPDGRLERHPPEGYPSLPLHRYLASVALVEDFWLKWRAGRRPAMAVGVTRLLIDQMAELCRAAGVEFSLVLLSTPKKVKRAYAEYAESHHIDVIDCDHEYGPEGIVPGEAHPNASVHQRWGDCVAAALAEPQRMPPRAADE